MAKLQKQRNHPQINVTRNLTYLNHACFFDIFCNFHVLTPIFAVILLIAIVSTTPGQCSPSHKWQVHIGPLVASKTDFFGGTGAKFVFLSPFRLKRIGEES